MGLFRRTPPLLLVTLLVLPAWLGSAFRQAKKTGASSPISRDVAADAQLARMRADVIQKMKDSRAGAEKLVALREEEVKRLTEEYSQRRDFYNQGLIAKVELD